MRRRDRLWWSCTGLGQIWVLICNLFTCDHPFPPPFSFTHSSSFLIHLDPSIFLLLAFPVNIQYVFHNPTSPLKYSIRRLSFLMRAMVILFPLFLPVIKFCMNRLHAFSSSFSGLRALGLAVVSVIYCSLGSVSGCLMYYFLCL